MALARMPWRKSTILEQCDPVYAWLVFDGLGFGDALFSTARALQGWQRVRSGYAARTYDQGVGRALWFASGGCIDGLLASIRSLDKGRHADLWSGLGFALTYAGGAGKDELSAVIDAAGPYRAQLATGSAFAAEAHARAGFIPPHTEEAAASLTRLDASSAGQLVWRSRRELPAATAPLASSPYETWRCNVEVAILQAWRRSRSRVVVFGQGRPALRCSRSHPGYSWRVEPEHRQPVILPINAVNGVRSDEPRDQAAGFRQAMHNLELFKRLTVTELTEITRKMKRRYFEKDQIIVREGDRGEEFFLVGDGLVDVRQAGRDGRHRHLATLSAGKFFGEGALLVDEPRNATCSAADDGAEVFVLTKADFRHALEVSANFKQQVHSVHLQRQ